MTRRDAIQVVTGVVGVLCGERLVKGQAQYQRPVDLRLVLDGTSGIEVVFQGQRQRITPAEIMAALGAKSD